MIHLVTILGWVAVVCGAGAAIGTWLQRGRDNAPLGIGWSYLIGTAAIGGLLHIPLAIDGRISHLSFLLTALIATMLSLGYYVQWFRGFRGRRAGGRIGGWLLDLPWPLRMVVCVTFVAAFVSAFLMPPNSYDGRAAFALKARVLYDAGTTRGEDFTDIHRLHFNAHYPLLVPLLEAELFWAQGSSDDQLLRVIFAMFVVSLIAVVIGELKRTMSPVAAAACGIFLLFTPYVLTTFEGGGLSASVDVPFACFVTAAVIEAGHWLRTQETRRALLAGGMLGAACLTKSEGTVWVAAMTAAFGLLCWRRPLQFRATHWRTATAGVAILLGMVALSMLARRQVPASPYLRDYAQAMRWDWLVQVWHRPLEIAQFAGQEYLNLEHWALFWPCVAAGFLLLRRRTPVSPEVWFARAVAILIFAADFAIFTITPYHLHFHLRTALGRLTLHFLPLVALVLAEQVRASQLAAELGDTLRQPQSVVDRGADDAEIDDLDKLDVRPFPAEIPPSRKAA